MSSSRLQTQMSMEAKEATPVKPTMWQSQPPGAGGDAC